MPTARMEAIIESTGRLVEYVNTWDSLGQQPDVCDFAFGNPQEFAIPGFAESLARHTTPHNKDWYAYKRSEPRGTGGGGQTPDGMARTSVRGG